MRHIPLLQLRMLNGLCALSDVGSGTSSLIPANIIRSRDRVILIRVDGESHDSLYFASRAYAATFARVFRLQDGDCDSVDYRISWRVSLNSQCLRQFYHGGKMGCEYSTARS